MNTVVSVFIFSLHLFYRNFMGYSNGANGDLVKKNVFLKSIEALKEKKVRLFLGLYCCNKRYISLNASLQIFIGCQLLWLVLNKQF